jgi:hypothetical protein
MSQVFTQNTAGSLVVLLSYNSTAVTGLIYSDVGCSIRKSGGIFATKTLTTGNFREIGSGAYEIDLTTSDLNTVGSISVMVDGADIDTIITTATVSASGNIVPGTSVTFETCVLWGHVVDATGVPQANISVSAQVLGLPSIEGSQAVLLQLPIATMTDANGQFFLSLVRLADVEIFIPSVEFRRRLVVPNQSSANLFTGVI